MENKEQKTQGDIWPRSSTGCEANGSEPKKRRKGKLKRDGGAAATGDGEDEALFSADEDGEDKPAKKVRVPVPRESHILIRL